MNCSEGCRGPHRISGPTDGSRSHLSCALVHRGSWLELRTEATTSRVAWVVSAAYLLSIINTG